MDEEEVLFVVLMDGGAGVWVLVMVDEEVLVVLDVGELVMVKDGVLVVLDEEELLSQGT